MNSKLNEMFEIIDAALNKAEAKTSAQARRKFLMETGVPASRRKKLKAKTNKAELDEDKKEENLEKNACQFTSFDNGDLKMEFGEDVPDLIKKRAMEWAKKRGFNPAEASLGKSSTGISWIILKK